SASSNRTSKARAHTEWPWAVVGTTRPRGERQERSQSIALPRFRERDQPPDQAVVVAGPAAADRGVPARALRPHPAPSDPQRPARAGAGPALDTDGQGAGRERSPSPGEGGRFLTAARGGVVLPAAGVDWRRGDPQPGGP